LISASWNQAQPDKGPEPPPTQRSYKPRLKQLINNKTDPVAPIDNYSIECLVKNKSQPTTKLKLQKFASAIYTAEIT
jgi:hypothetical protein